MEEGAFRCDANISTRTVDGSIIGEKVEIKNMNSFRAVERALLFEEERQRAVLARGESIPQETRGWVDNKGITVSQRTKESAHDYRYFPEPDLPPLAIEADVCRCDSRIAARSFPRRARPASSNTYGLGCGRCGPSDAGTRDGRLFRSSPTGDAPGARQSKSPTGCSTMSLDLQRERGMPFDQFPLEPASTGAACRAGRERRFDRTRRQGSACRASNPARMPATAAERLNLISVDDADVIRAAARDTLAANPGGRCRLPGRKEGGDRSLDGRNDPRNRRPGSSLTPVRAMLEELLSE